MADTEITVQAQSTEFRRSGVTNHKKGYYIPGSISDLFYQLAYNASTNTTNASAMRQMLYNLFVQDPTYIPGGLTLKNIQSLFPTAFSGAPDLQSIYRKLPFSTEFETETKALYERQYSKARTEAQSGPTYVRGATARQAFELAALDTEMANNRFLQVWQAQVAIAQIVVAAVQTASQAESERWRLQLQAQQQQAATEQGRVVQSLSAAENAIAMQSGEVRALGASSEFLGQQEMVIREDLLGSGFQQGTPTGFGTSYWR
jgi:hypothetical protein